MRAYLGDGVYASSNGDYIALSTERDGGVDIIYLDSEVLYALIEFLKKATGKEIVVKDKQEAENNG